MNASSQRNHRSLSSVLRRAGVICLLSCAPSLVATGHDDGKQSSSAIILVQPMKPAVLNALGSIALSDEEIERILSQRRGEIEAAKRSSGAGRPDENIQLAERTIGTMGSLVRQEVEDRREVILVVSRVDIRGAVPKELVENAYLEVAKGNFASAKQLFEQVRGREIAFKGSATQQAADSAFGLALISAREFKYERAGEYLEEAIRWAPDNPLYVAYLAHIEAFRGRFDSAKANAQKTQALLGNAESNFDRANIERWLGDTLQDVFAFSEAIGHYESSAKLMEPLTDRIYRTDHAYLLQNLASLYMRIREYPKAQEMYRSTLKEYGAIGMPREDILTIHNNLGVMYLTMGCYDPAIANTEEVIALRGSVISERSPILAFSLHTNGNALVRKGDYKNAVRRLRDGHDVLIATFSREHWRVAQFKISLAEALMTIDQREEAGSLLRAAQEILRDNNKRPAYQMAKDLALLARWSVSNQPASFDRLIAQSVQAMEEFDDAERVTAIDISWRLKLAQAEREASASNNDKALQFAREVAEQHRDGYFFVREKLVIPVLASLLAQTPPNVPEYPTPGLCTSAIYP